MTGQLLSPINILLIIIYLLIIGFIACLYAFNKYKDTPETKKIFLWGFIYKIFMGLAFAFVYVFYYKGESDTFYYFNNARYLGEMLFENPKAYFMMLFDLVNETNIYELGNNINYWPRFRDPAVYATHRYLSLFTIIGLKNYYITIICLNTFLFILNWKTYRYFSNLFPKYSKIIAICILFIPSATFWGSGILKDSFTYTFSLVFIILFHKVFFAKKVSIMNIIKILFCAYIILSLKPYIFYSLLVSCFIWLGFIFIYKIKNKVVRVFILPVIILMVGFIGLRILSMVMDMVGGAYGDIEALLNKAAISNYDLKQEYYQGASFDIGDYEPTIQGALSVAPKAVIACFYRPYIWEVRSAVMLLSSIENTILLLLSVLIILRVGIIRLFKEMKQNSFLIFCIVFTISLSLGVGLSTSNFGALVRFKIPMLPFFFMFLLIILKDHSEELKEKTPVQS